MINPSSDVQVRSGSYEDALLNGHRLLEKDPNSALKQAETLVRLKKDPRAFRLAAAACRELGFTKDAEGAELGGIEAGLASPELKKAAIASAESQYSNALAIAERFLRAEPDDLLALTIAAEASIGVWSLETAEQMLRTVLERAPAFLRASMLLAACLGKQVRVRDAIAVLDDVVSRKPGNIPALTQLAKLRFEARDVDQAAAIYERLVSQESGRFEFWVQLAQYYRILGRREESIAAFRRSLTANPDNGSAWWSLANYFPDDVSDQDEKAVRTALTEKAGKPDECPLQLAVGLLDDRAEDRQAAFDHFAKGKKIRASDQLYDAEAISTAVDGVIQLFNPDFYERRRLAGWRNSSPIFILGMPRAGTTLVERILGRHSKIEGAGELQIIPRLAEIARRQADDPEHYAAMLQNLSDKQLAWVGERYVRASQDFRLADKPFFIDKANLNWMQIGLILLALPDARVIDVRRNALDCCWANFKMLFNEGFPAANDLRHIGLFYRDYVRLLDAMSVAAPGRILRVRYEDVIDDIEGQTRRMLDFLGFEYEAQCIDFHLATEAVATASSEQVRRPLNRKGIGSAEPYRPWLGPLIEELGPLAEPAA